MSEAELIERVSEYLSSELPLVFREIPMLGRYVDVVGYNPDTRRLVMVEGKTVNWRRAIRQAMACRLATDEVYIAMPEALVHRVQKDVLDEAGVGLLSVGEGVVEVSQPSAHSLRSDYYSVQACSLLDRINNRAI